MVGETGSRRHWPAWLKVVVIGRHPRRTLWRIGILIVTCFIVFRFVLLPVRVEGQSMWPTHRNQEWNFANRLAYRWSPPRRGDVVCIRLAGPQVMFLKRIVGLPGETVEFRDGRVFINGQRLSEPYVRTRCNWNETPKQVGPEEIYVVGDNRAMPASNHVHGITDRWRVIGKVLL